MSVDHPIGGMIQNLINLQRLGNAMSADADALVRELFDDLAAQIARIDPTAPERDRYRRMRLEELLGRVELLVGQRFTEIRKALRQRLAELGAQQATWAEGQLQRTIGAIGYDIRSARVGVNMMKSIIDSDPFQGETLKGWADTQDAATVRRVRRQLQMGMVQNEPVGDLIRRVRGHSDRHGGFTGGVLDSTTRETEAIVRTGVNFVANRAHAETYRENADVVTGLERVATLDSRTTLICMSLDGSVIPSDSTDLPPYHYNCRTVVVPVIDWKRLGIEPPAGTRASTDGPVSSSTTYEEWLRDQPRAFQDQVLGPARADLFRANKVSLRDLVTQDHQVLTLSELRP